MQLGGYGGRGDTLHKPDGAPDGAYYDPRAYARNMLRMIEHGVHHLVVVDQAEAALVQIA